MENTLKKVVLAALLVLAALVSGLLLAERASAPETYAGTIRSIDEKTETVLTLTAASTLASAGISAIPGDTATPIAQKLADFTEYFLLILCVLYCEKYLLTIIGAGVFKVLIPVVCALGILCLLLPRRPMPRRAAVKLLLFSIVLYFLIPASIGVADLVYSTYRSSIDTLVSSTEALTQETEGLEEQAAQSGIFGALTDTANALTEKAAGVLRKYVETLAVLIVTSCLIPILTLLFFLWLVKQLTGIDLNLTLPPRRSPAPRDDGSPGARPENR